MIQPIPNDRLKDHAERTTFSEGVDIGYRGFDKRNIEPLFPFGYGLSYATFSYSDLEVQAASDQGLDVSLRVTNTSKVSGDEVPQSISMHRNGARTAWGLRCGRWPRSSALRLTPEKQRRLRCISHRAASSIGRLRRIDGCGPGQDKSGSDRLLGT